MNNNIKVQQYTQEEIKNILQMFEESIKIKTYHHIGYPYNLEYKYGELEHLQKYSINNLGDPFIESNYAVHSREFEIAVLDWFAEMWSIKNDYWGYVTNCGTEGNLYGILLGRENMGDNAILYASKESHYSIFKAAKMFKIPLVIIDTTSNGEIDYNDLDLKLQPEHRVILNLNIGTTVKGAIDNIDKVLDILRYKGFSNNDFFIHCDGALFGIMLPFVKTELNTPYISFKKPISSISVSGHKFIGSPIPCGVVITRKSLAEKISNNIDYINSKDSTIMGSRNGHTPIYMWYTLCKKNLDQIKQDVELCIELAIYLENKLQEIGYKPMRNKLSCTVVFDKPTDNNIVKKWQLACEGDRAHVVVMPNVTIEKLNEFISDCTCFSFTNFDN